MPLNPTQVNLANGFATNYAVVSTVDALMQTAEVTVTPTVTTANTYGSSYCVGGLLSFDNITQNKGTGVIRSARLTGVPLGNYFSLYLFNSNPTTSTFIDNQVCDISAADVTKVFTAVVFDPSASTMLLGYETGIDTYFVLGENNTTMYGVLVADMALTHPFTSTSQITLGLTVKQFGN